VSLYRTWRPKSFADLVGQDAVVRTLRTALVSGKLAHAYLFSGPRGSGKTSAAKILARCIDCELGPTPEPDNTCANCRAILAGSALDVLEIDAASNRGIDEIRALRESVKFAPASMRMKVFIIDEAHMLTREGANAFLKTLEEPPPHVCFILATTAPEALPPTILSRCQRYAFRRIPVSVMIARMREIADSERIEIDDGALGAIAYRADGGLRDALTMLEQVASYAGGAVDARAVDAAFGTTGREYASALCRAILGGEAATALRTVDQASDAGADMLGLVRGTIAEYRNLLVARIEPELLSRDLSSADSESVVALAGATPQPKVVRGLRLLADALAAGRSSGNPRLELETAVLRLVVQGEDPSLEALATRVALLEAGTPTVALPVPLVRPEREPPVGRAPERAVVPAPLPEQAPVLRNDSGSRPAPLVPSSAEPAPAAVVPPVFADAAVGVAPLATTTIQQVRSLWDQIRLRAEERHKPLRAPLSQATVDGLEGNALVIGVVDALQESIMRERTAIVEGAVADVVRVPLRVLFKPRAASVRGVRATPPERTATPSGSASAPGGEIDLMSYARKKLGGTETT
jgi:DNA polymerase-3 subunit gamma/tau